MEIGADGSFLHIFAGYMVRGKLGRQVLQKNEKRLAREQRKLSRCVKESRNYVRQKKKVASCHEKI